MPLVELVRTDATDDIINAGGEKLSLTEVENVLRRHPLVHDVACIGVPHERFGELPAALVVCCAGIWGPVIAKTAKAIKQ